MLATEEQVTPSADESDWTNSASASIQQIKWPARSVGSVVTDSNVSSLHVQIVVRIVAWTEGELHYAVFILDPSKIIFIPQPKVSLASVCLL